MIFVDILVCDRDFMLVVIVVKFWVNVGIFLNLKCFDLGVFRYFVLYDFLIFRFFSLYVFFLVSVL